MEGEMQKFERVRFYGRVIQDYGNQDDPSGGVYVHYDVSKKTYYGAWQHRTASGWFVPCPDGDEYGLIQEGEDLIMARLDESYATVHIYLTKAKLRKIIRLMKAKGGEK